MIRLKKKAAAAAAPKEDEKMADAPKANGEEKVSILGIGGRKVAKATGSKKRKTPGEIRIQKDIAELDGGDVAQIKFPNANDLTKFNVIVTPDTGFWKGGRREGRGGQRHHCRG